MLTATIKGWKARVTIWSTCSSIVLVMLIC